MVLMVVKNWAVCLNRISTIRISPQTLPESSTFFFKRDWSGCLVCTRVRLTLLTSLHFNKTKQVWQKSSGVKYTLLEQVQVRSTMTKNVVYFILFLCVVFCVFRFFHCGFLGNECNFRAQWRSEAVPVKLQDECYNHNWTNHYSLVASCCIIQWKWRIWRLECLPSQSTCFV